MAGAGSTILDYLNEDCWRAVLDYVPVRDIMRSELTSRRWHEIVLVYLQSIRISIKHPGITNGETDRNVHSLLLRSNNYYSFESWTKKLGSSVVAICCDSEDSLKFIDNCPNLEVVTFIELTDNALLNASQTRKLKHIQSVIFMSCQVSDHCISQFVANDALQKLEINDPVDSGVTGQCLKKIHSKTLKTLVLKGCYALETRHLLSAAEHLSELTKLLLLDAPGDIYNNVHLLLDKMPKLECLYLIGLYNFDKAGDSIFTRVSRLSRLKCLYLNIQPATDQDLELVTRHCQELRVLWLGSCDDVTRRGVAAVCNYAGERLVALGLWYCDLLDDGIMLIVHSCPNLKWLDVNWRLTPAERRPARAAEAQRAQHPRLRNIYQQEQTKRYSELDLHYHEFKDRNFYDIIWK